MLKPGGRGGSQHSRGLMRSIIDGLLSCHRADTNMSPLIKKQTTAAGFGTTESGDFKERGLTCLAILAGF